MRRLFLKVTIIVLLLAGVGFAQENPFSFGPKPTIPLWTGGTNDTPRWGKFSDFDGSILFCRGFYKGQDWNEGVFGWWTDYPGLDHNFLARLTELTAVKVRLDHSRIPLYVVVRLDDPLMFRCPVLFMSDPSRMELSESEVLNLRAFLLKGGFIWFDDFWGSKSFDIWEEQMRKILPSGLYPMIDIPKDHAIMHMLYNVTEIPQISNVGFWTDNNGETSEKGADSAVVHFKGIQDERGRLMIVTTHNTDIGDGIEEEVTGNLAYFKKYSSKAYAIAINIFLYGITH